MSFLSLLLLVACGGSGGDPATSPPPSGPSSGATNDPYQGISLGAPSTLDGVSVLRGTNGRVDGADFRTDVGPVLVTASGTEASFDPDWAPELGPDFDQAAWALYLLDVSGQELPQSLQFDWTVAPAAEDLWIGLANWETNQWRWGTVSGVGAIALPNPEEHVRTSDGMLAVVVLLGGQVDAALAEVYTPGSPSGNPGGFVNADAPMGVNLEHLDDAARSIVFTDAFKHARAWIPQTYPFNGTWDTGDTIATDANGWPSSLQPGQAAATVLMLNQENNYPAGDYVCLYDGTGDIDFRGDATVMHEEPGRLVVNVQPTSSLTVLSIVATDPNDPVRNVRFIMPGFEASYETQIFHPDFLDSLAPYGVLRFMDWGRTNDSPVSSWSERTTPDSFSQADIRKGVAFEYMIQLANETMSDAWICVPHLADDNFVRELAKLVRDNLHPQLRCYVEYSNEVWNDVFDQASYAQTEGLALGLSVDPMTARLRFYSQRAVEVFQLFDDAFVGQEDRLVRVLAGQSTVAHRGVEIMDWQSAYEVADAYAVAPYFGNHLGHPDNVPTTLGMSVSQVLAECELDSINKQSTQTSQNAANAAARGLALVAYEGGQHLVGINGEENNQTLTDLFHAANRDAGMRQLYRDDLWRWHQNGGGLFMGFTHTWMPTKWGAWGIFESQYQDPQTAPKWLGIQDYLNDLANQN